MGAMQLRISVWTCNIVVCVWLMEQIANAKSCACDNVRVGKCMMDCCSLMGELHNDYWLQTSHGTVNMQIVISRRC